MKTYLVYCTNGQNYRTRLFDTDNVSKITDELSRTGWHMLTLQLIHPETVCHALPVKL